MKKSLFILTALVMVLALVLTACGGGATPTPEAEEPAEEMPAEEEPMEEEPAEEAPELNGEKVQIRWFVGLGTGTDPAQVDRTAGSRGYLQRLPGSHRSCSRSGALRFWT